VDLGSVMLIALMLWWAADSPGAISVRIVPQWAKMVVYRWVRLVHSWFATRAFVPHPVADRGSIVDLREQFIEVPRQTAITKEQCAASASTS